MKEQINFKNIWLNTNEPLVIPVQEVEEVSPEEILNDLYNVGKTKSLGYLPIETITKYNKAVSDFVTYSNNNNLSILKLSYPDECRVSGGALYMYHENMLSDILKKYTTILSNASVPHSNNIEYIRYISKNIVHIETYPDAYRVIGLTFNDKRFSDDD